MRADEVFRKENLEREELRENLGVYLESWCWKGGQRKIDQRDRRDSQDDEIPQEQNRDENFMKEGLIFSMK